MSLLAEVAARAGVPVEGVVRVVTRQPVSRRIEQRVVEILDSLEPEQLRALERLARAGSPEVVSPSPEVRPARTDAKPAASAGSDELTLRLAMLLEEVAVRLNELRREQLSDRQDRVDDLAVLVDLMTTGWRGVDRRLARVERSLSRLEPQQEAPARLVVPMPEPPPTQAGPQSRNRSRNPRSRKPPRGGPRVPCGGACSPRSRRCSSLRGLPLRSCVRALPFPGGRAAARVDRCSPAPPRSLSSTTGDAATPAPASTPRVLAWLGQPGVAYYLVRVRRGPTLVYEGRPKTPRLVLPESVTRMPGTYRWSVRAGVGAPSQNRLGDEVVDSTFVVTG